tara:strand:- start:5 stop:289 length:285 start_codon:yes stop_codon:yes gene_type:complete
MFTTLIKYMIDVVGKESVAIGVKVVKNDSFLIVKELANKLDFAQVQKLCPTEYNAVIDIDKYSNDIKRIMLYSPKSQELGRLANTKGFDSMSNM